MREKLKNWDNTSPSNGALSSDSPTTHWHALAKVIPHPNRTVPAQHYYEKKKKKKLCLKTRTESIRKRNSNLGPVTVA